MNHLVSYLGFLDLDTELNVTTVLGICHSGYETSLS